MMGAAGDYFFKNEPVKWCFSKMMFWILASKVEPVKWCTTVFSPKLNQENEGNFTAEAKTFHIDK